VQKRYSGGKFDQDRNIEVIQVMMNELYPVHKTNQVRMTIEKRLYERWPGPGNHEGGPEQSHPRRWTRYGVRSGWTATGQKMPPG
jgi:hypothetical protein